MRGSEGQSARAGRARGGIRKVRKKKIKYKKGSGKVSRAVANDASGELLSVAEEGPVRKVASCGRVRFGFAFSRSFVRGLRIV